MFLEAHDTELLRHVAGDRRGRVLWAVRLLAIAPVGLLVAFAGLMLGVIAGMVSGSTSLVAVMSIVGGVVIVGVMIAWLIGVWLATTLPFTRGWRSSQGARWAAAFAMVGVAGWLSGPILLGLTTPRLVFEYLAIAGYVVTAWLLIDVCERLWSMTRQARYQRGVRQRQVGRLAPVAFRVVLGLWVIAAAVAAVIERKPPSAGPRPVTTIATLLLIMAFAYGTTALITLARSVQDELADDGAGAAPDPSNALPVAGGPRS